MDAMCTLPNPRFALSRGSSSRVLFVCAILVGLVGTFSCEGVLDPTMDSDLPPNDSGTCNPTCPMGWICQGGQCLSSDDPCVSITCAPGTRCSDGTCLEVDLCEDVVCPNAGDTCQGGECVSGAADNDNDGYIARDDCNDTNALIHPGSAEACNGLDDDCNPGTADGADECPGSCCGTGPSCNECCSPEDCGAGDWSCLDFTCTCDGRMCDGACVSGAGCCAASDCGTGEWECSDHQCFCPGDITP